MLIGLFSGVFALSFSPKHLKFWIESYLNKPNAKLGVQFKDIKLSLSQWGVLPVFGLKSSSIDIKIKSFENSCFDIDTLRLNTVFLKINPLDLLFGKLHFSSLKVNNVDLNFNSFCEDLSMEKISTGVSYFMHNKARSEVNNFTKWIDEIKINNFLLSNQVGKIALIENLKLSSYKKPTFIVLSGDIFPYLQNSFTFIKPIKSKIFIYPHIVKANWWWHLYEGIVELNTQLRFSMDKQLKQKYQSQLNVIGNVSYLPISSALNLLQKMDLINIKFPDLSAWLSCSFNTNLKLSNPLPVFFNNSRFHVENCKVRGSELKAGLGNSSWGIKPLRVNRKTNLDFSNLSVEKFINPIFTQWEQKFNYFPQLKPSFRGGRFKGTASILKTGVWSLDANLKDSVLNFKAGEQLEWFSIPEVDLSIKTTPDLSNILVNLNNISVPKTLDSKALDLKALDSKSLNEKVSNKKTKVFFKYNKIAETIDDQSLFPYVLTQLNFNRQDLSSLKGFPLLNYLDKKSEELAKQKLSK